MFILLSLALAADRVEEASTLALGSSAVAAPDENSSIAANPGVIGLSERYHFSLGFGYGGRGIHWNLTALDSHTTSVAFGMSYSGDRFNPPLETYELPGYQVPGETIRNLKFTHDIGFALAIPTTDRRFSGGLGGSVSFFNNDRQGQGITWNLSGGLGFRPIKSLVLGVSARNFVPTRFKTNPPPQDVSVLLPVGNPAGARPFELLLGARLGDDRVGAIILEGGARPLRAAPLVLAAGAEVYVDTTSIRAGWRLENGTHQASIGVGAGAKDARIDLAWMVPILSIGRPVDWTLALSVRFKGPDPDSINPDNRFD